MRGGIHLLLVVTVILCAKLFAYDWSTNPGNGSAQNPYQISTPEQLMSIGSDPMLLTKSFVLTNDIVFDPDHNPAHVFTDALIASDIDTGAMGFQGNGFTGKFNGNGFVVANLTINNSTRSYVALFGKVDLGGEVKNLGVVNIDIHAGSYAGALCGYNYRGRINSCFGVGKISGVSYIGGLIGYSSYRVDSCYTKTSIDGMGNNIGGLIGTNTGVIISSYATENVNITGKWNGLVGGLVGDNNYGTISTCYATGDVSGVRDWCGGLTGYNNEGTIIACYATGDVNGANSNVGGLIGRNYLGEVKNCYSTGKPSGYSNVGGLCGSSYITNQSDDTSNFWDSDTSEISTSAMGTNKTSVEMKAKTTFTDAGWDFVGESANGNNDIWRMCVDGVDYPRLSWEFAQDGDFACGEGVDLADLLALAENWLLQQAVNPTTFNYACDATRDEIINLQDLAVLSDNWQ